MLPIIYVVALIAASTPDATFCGRLASAVKMKVNYDDVGRRIYSRSMYHLKDFFIGGNETVTMGIDPGDDVTLEQFRLVRKACETSSNGDASCAIAGPETFEMVIDGQKQRIPAFEGEKALVRVVSSHVYCNEDPATP